MSFFLNCDTSRIAVLANANPDSEEYRRAHASLLEDCYTDSDIEDELDRIFAQRAASHRAAREEMELSHGEVW